MAFLNTHIWPERFSNHNKPCLTSPSLLSGTLLERAIRVRVMSRRLHLRMDGDDSVRGEGSFSPDRRREGKAQNRMGSKKAGAQMDAGF